MPTGLASGVSMLDMDDDELIRDVTKLRRLETQADELRTQIRAQVLAKRNAGVSQADLTRMTGWTRETIRKIERRGTQPCDAPPRSGDKSSSGGS